MKKRKLAFFEIGQGQLGRDLQADFEKAQNISVIRGLPVKINLQITVNPPDVRDDSFCTVNYTHKINEPAHQSRAYEMLRRNDKIVSDAANPMEQLDLDLESNKTISINRKVGNDE